MILGVTTEVLDDVLNIKNGVFTLMSTSANGPGNGNFYAISFGSSFVKTIIAIQTNGGSAYFGCVRDGQVMWKKITSV